VRAQPLPDGGGLSLRERHHQSSGRVLDTAAALPFATAGTGGWASSSIMLGSRAYSGRFSLSRVVLPFVLAAAACTAASEEPFRIFSPGVHGAVEYRIPILVALEQGRVLLAFAEARLPCTSTCGGKKFWGDSSPKHIALRRSEDYGVSWFDYQIIVESNGTNDNLNLGSAVVDKISGAVLLQWGGCVHCSCTGSVPKPAPGKCDANNPMGNVQQIRSTNAGQTWGAVEDISSQLLDEEHPIFKLGEGSGLQLPTGEMIVCGRFSNLGAEGCNFRPPARSVAVAGGGSNCGSACIASTDGGLHWARRGAVRATAEFGDNECEPTLLNNGSILLNMRAGRVRLLGLSNDKAETFVNVHPAPDLSPVADCQGSMQAVSNGMLLFTAPAGSAKRRNLSLAVSRDQGSSWQYQQVVYANASAYSSLAPRIGAPGSGACAALLFETMSDEEDVDALHVSYDGIYFTNVCAA
jgi:hypothetical protein